MTVLPSAIRGVCLDVDGVLTDGRIYFDDAGQGTRVFHVLDGFALHWYLKLGGTVIICTGKTSEAVAHRARELGIEHLIQGSRDKVADLQPLLERLNLRFEHLAMIGDDLPDIPVMRRCGLPIAVANAVAEVKAAARFVTQQPGGAGAVREALEHVMRATGQWAEVSRHYGLSET